MKTRNIKLAGILLISMLMVTMVNAQRPNYGGQGQGEKMNRTDYLDLTEAQQAEITSLRTEHFKAVTPLKNKMAELKARERTLLSEESVDMKAVNKVIDEQTGLASSIRKLQVKQQVAIKGLLTDEQAMKLQQGRKFAQQEGFHGNRGHHVSGNAGLGRGNAEMGRGNAGMGRGNGGMGRGNGGYRGI